MGENALRSFSSRAPRYFLKPEDNTLLMYGQELKAMRSAMHFLDISSTGLAFVISRQNAPPLGHLLRFQFTIPGASTVRVWGKVVRIGEYEGKRWWSKTDPDTPDPNEIFVGVHFHELTDELRLMIEDSVKRKLIEAHKENSMFLIKYARQQLEDPKKRPYFILACAGMSFVLLYLLASWAHHSGFNAFENVLMQNQIKLEENRKKSGY